MFQQMFWKSWTKTPQNIFCWSQGIFSSCVVTSTPDLAWPSIGTRMASGFCPRPAFRSAVLSLKSQMCHTRTLEFTFVSSGDTKNPLETSPSLWQVRKGQLIKGDSVINLPLWWISLKSFHMNHLLHLQIQWGQVTTMRIMTCRTHRQK